MKHISVDVEADGPCPGLYSMVSFGAVVVERNLDNVFYGQTKPISDHWIPESLAISKITREEHKAYDSPEKVMMMFTDWLTSIDNNVVFISDNPAFDWQFINYYFHAYTGGNPFGHSARRIGDLYCGLTNDMRNNRKWKRLRKTKHTHNPVDDAKGNAEALLAMSEKYDLNI